jgi:formylglycine-generating enzyme required for sulfatase activity
MGSETGDPDERPVHPRRLPAFWITEAPITWHDHCVLLGWSAPPEGWPPEGTEIERDERFELAQRSKIRLQYCESETLSATMWHAHAHADPELAGKVARRDPAAERRYDRKPMIAAAPHEAERLAAHLSTPAVRYALPTEAQWEKAARGGLVGCRYAWGDAPPTRERCDFDRMGDYRLIDPRELPPNGYGLFGMCGGVSEWTADVYDALAYHRARAGDLSPPAPPEEAALGVLRGGAWTDCADAVTVSYRTAYRTDRGASPTIGFRLVRMTA